MNNVTNITLGTFDYSEYPFISFTVSEFDGEVKKSHITSYMSSFKSIVDSHAGPFALLIDSTHAKWISAEHRDHFGVAVQLLEKEYQDRHIGNFVYINNFKIFLLAKLVSGFLKTKVPVHFSFNKEKLKERAINALNESISQPLPQPA